METRYQILVNIKVPEGRMEIGRFFIGEDLHLAQDIFEAMDGKKDANDDALIRLDLVQVEEGISLILGSIHCTLLVLQEYCGIITKEIFKTLAIGRD